MENFISIGFTKKTYGTNGELKMKIEEKYIEDFLNAKVVFLAISGKKVPFFIEKVRFGNALLAKFEDLDSLQEAQMITSKEVFIREKDLMKEEDKLLEVEETLVYKKYEGFLIIDSNAGEIGSIKEILEYPQQEMALINFQDRELLIPMNEGLIDEINKEEKQILMNLPEGLLEL